MLRNGREMLRGLWQRAVLVMDPRGPQMAFNQYRNSICKLCCSLCQLECCLVIALLDKVFAEGVRGCGILCVGFESLLNEFCTPSIKLSSFCIGCVFVS
jgi:hypothetical protein